MSMTLEAALEAKIATTFELTDQRNSGFQLKGTEGGVNPICLRSSKLNLLTMTSEICLGKGKGYARIQYVPNAPVIHIEDLWKDEKGMLHSMAEKQGKNWEKQLGLKSLGYNLDAELRKAKDLKIGFEFGLLTLDKHGDDPTLLTYVTNHHCNVERPNAKDDTKQHTGLFKFRSVQQEKKAEVQLENIDKELQASEYISSLRVKGKVEYTKANKSKIDATLRILHMTPGCQPEQYSQKHLALKQYADANPVQFIEFIEESLDQFRVEIGKAVGYKVLELNDKEAKLVISETGKEPKSTKILSFETSTQESRMEELCLHFINDAGIIDYKNMLMQVGFAAAKN